MEENVQDSFKKEHEKLGQLFFELGRAHHELELARASVTDWEVKCRNQNKKALEAYSEVQKVKAVEPAGLSVVEAPTQ